MMDLDSAVSRIESKLSRLSEDLQGLSGISEAEASEMAESILDLSITRQHLLDLGFLIQLRAVRLKLDAFRLMADLSDMEILESADATISEVEDFYREIQEEWEAGKVPPPNPEPDLIPPMPEVEKKVEFDISAVDNPRLFGMIAGFFEDHSDVRVEIPQDLLNLSPIDMEALQGEVMARIGEGSSVRRLAGGFQFGRRTLGLVFMACLFLDISGSAIVSQAEDDVIVTAA